MILKIFSILMSAFISMTMIVKVYSQILTDKSLVTCGITVSGPSSKTNITDFFITVSDVEENFEEENDSELDKLSTLFPTLYPHSSFNFFFEVKLHRFIIGITYLFANIKASYCSGLYILHESIIV